MKSYSNVYETLLDKKLIARCFWDASKGKRSFKRIRNILLNLEQHVNKVYEIIKSQTFKSDNHTEKKINENSSKKTRVIIKPNYAYEQVIHHLAMSHFKEVVTKKLYHLSCANIPGMGIKFGDKFVTKWVKQLGNKKLYILKMDIHHYYNSIDRNILKMKLRKLYKDDKYYNLLCEIIDYDHVENGVGIPLGFYSSQWFGNFYLLDFDYYVKQTLNAKYYIRYADDMVIFGTNKKELHKMREQISEYLKNQLHLELKGNWQVFRFEYYDKKTDRVRGRALDFLGYVYHYNRKTLRKSILCRSRRKALRIKKAGKITWYSATQMISYLGWYSNSDTYNYFKEYIYPIVKPKALRRVISKHVKEVNKNGTIKWSDIRSKTKIA